jgi:hypothetical protein
MKKCKNCKINKSVDCFQTWTHPKNKKEYTRNTCRECINLRTQKRKTPSDLRAHAQREKRRREDPAYRMYHGAKQRAKKQNLPFDLDQKFIQDLIPTHCPVFGIPLKNGTNTFHNNSLSLDKLIPSKGYIKGNVCVISDRANRIKRDATLDELKKLVYYLESKGNQ